MSSMNNLDLIVRDKSCDESEYDENKTLISMHLNGELEFKDLPQHLQDAMIQWENDELELTSKENYHDIQSWEDYA